HAGLRPGVALEEQNRQDLLWIRHEFLESTADFGKLVIHGHSPLREVCQRPNRIGIDTGAYSTDVLTAIVLEGNERRFIQTGEQGGVAA
ncbi:MAG: serine/threonine protein phosphatase, partial [Alphaproteobacteria bacterium]|nr:serine/threonine protein phosphatase [Alphaproteobacteria bacterium]